MQEMRQYKLAGGKSYCEFGPSAGLCYRTAACAVPHPYIAQALSPQQLKTIRPRANHSWLACHVTLTETANNS